MLVHASFLVCMLFLILISAQGFSNALEYLGQKLKISEGVTGSVFAAVATALPETSVPILAILAGGANSAVNEDVGVGAILGAPLMLATLSMFCLLLFSISKRKLTGKLLPERTGYVRDINFFLGAFVLATSAMYLSIQHILFKIGICLALVSLYSYYLFLTFKASAQLIKQGHLVKPLGRLFVTKIGLANNLFSISLQLIFSLIILLIAVKGFIYSIEYLSHALNISTLIFSLVIVPIATELPEKVNSILWVRKNKDTLGLGNITGALVFQSALLPALGVMLTPWHLSAEVIPGLVITGLAAIWLRIIAFHKGIPIYLLIINGILYMSYFYWILQ